MEFSQTDKTNQNGELKLATVNIAYLGLAYLPLSLKHIMCLRERQREREKIYVTSNVDIVVGHHK